MLPKEFAGGDVVRENRFAKHDGIRDRRRLEVRQPVRVGVYRVPMEAGALEILVRPIVRPRIALLDRFKFGRHRFGRVLLVDPFAVLHERIPEVTILVGQRRSACAEQPVAVDGDVPPTQRLAAGRAGDAKLPQRLPRLRVELKHSVVRRDE